MPQTIQKWGNSLACRLPKAVAEQANFAEDTPVTIRVEGEQIIISKARVRRRIDADELISRITPDNLHAPVEFGAPVGNEAI